MYLCVYVGVYVCMCGVYVCMYVCNDMFIITGKESFHTENQISFTQKLLVTYNSRQALLVRTCVTIDHKIMHSVSSPWQRGMALS